MTWLGPRDEEARTSVIQALGGGDRELVQVWGCSHPVADPDDWLAVVNEMARATPGTLAHRACQDDRMPEQFRTVAPSFGALGWRVIDRAVASRELGAVLQGSLLGANEVRSGPAASAVVTAFLQLFGQEARFLTNQGDSESAAVNVRSTGSWTAACPLTPAVAEAGLVAVGGGRAGLLWVAES